MRSTRASAAWAAVAIATSLLGMTIVSAQNTTADATSGFAPPNSQATGTSNTGSNPLHTISPVVDESGRPLNPGLDTHTNLPH